MNQSNIDIIYFGANWCKHTKKLLENPPEFEYTLVLIDKDNESFEFAKKFNIENIPATIYLDETGNFQQFLGFKHPEMS